jgi:transitional endoplasmic reticulum ATPase
MKELTPEAELHFTRGLLHLRRGEAVMPYSMAISEEKAPPGTDVLLALLGLAAVATSRAFGQTRWIEEYRAEMRAALTHFDRVADLVPTFPDNHYRRAQALRYLGETEAALQAARRAVELAPDNREFTAFLRALDGGAQRRAQQIVGQDASRPLGWDDVILPAKAKRELRQMQLVLENPSQARALGVEPPTGLLLYGPPGTGKTTIARVLAAQTKAHFLTTSPAEINQMWMGESEKSVARLFGEARSNAPSILFLDEIDALLAIRVGGINQYSDKVVNQFLHEMDGLTPNQGIFVIGATNRPDMLDPALIRGGRLSRQIEIPLPDYEAREALLRLNTRTALLAPSVDLARLARETEGFSGGDLRALVNEAGLQALIRLADEGGTRALTWADFHIATENLRRG